MKNLNDQNKKNPFRIPENYFAEVNMKIISATSSVPSADDKKIGRPGIYNRFRTRLLIAASITGFILLSWYCIKDLFRSKIRNEAFGSIHRNEF